MSNRQLLLALAVGAAVVGLAIAFVPGLDAGVSLPMVVTALLAVGAVIGGTYRSWQWLRRDLTQATPPVIEGTQPITAPGDDVDALLARVSSAGSVGRDSRAIGIRREIRHLAIDVLVEYRGLSESDAADSLDAGDWTDDPVAAEFFTSLYGTGSSTTESVAGFLWGTGPFRKRAGRVIAEINDILETREEP